MAINLAGYLYSDNGTLIDGADVTLLASDGSTEATTTTNATGVSVTGHLQKQMKIYMTLRFSLVLRSDTSKVKTNYLLLR